jgi:hypothetical protein
MLKQANSQSAVTNCCRSICQNVYDRESVTKPERWLLLRAKVKVTGIVQGVGFRPFIYRTAVTIGLKGYVKNRGDAGVEILLEGGEPVIKNFLEDLKESTT